MKDRLIYINLQKKEEESKNGPIVTKSVRRVEYNVNQESNFFFSLTPFKMAVKGSLYVLLTKQEFILFEANILKRIFVFTKRSMSNL